MLSGLLILWKREVLEERVVLENWWSGDLNDDG